MHFKPQYLVLETFLVLIRYKGVKCLFALSIVSLVCALYLALFLIVTPKIFTRSTVLRFLLLTTNYTKLRYAFAV